MRRAFMLLALLAGPAHAEDPEGPPPAQAVPAGTAPKAEGEYGGVQPGQAKKPEPGKKPRKPPPKGTLSWVGFEARGGTSDVFFQSVAAFEVSQRVDNGVLIATLGGLTRMGPNTWRPIDTRFFETPLARITAKKKGRAIEVRITFKNAKDATQGQLRGATEADGMYYAYLTFQGGGTTAAPSTMQEPEK